jgi:uncharacterized protein YndB with AHSA1/START domain
VFDALATLDGLRAWWTSRASGTASPGGAIRLAFDGLDEHIDLQVIAFRRPAEVEWRILEHTAVDAAFATMRRKSMLGIGCLRTP